MFKLVAPGTGKTLLAGVQVFTDSTNFSTGFPRDIQVLFSSCAQRSRSYANVTYACVAQALKLIYNICAQELRSPGLQTEIVLHLK